MRDYLKQLRKQKGLTQSVVANKLGCSQNHYSNIENGERQKDIKYSILIQLAEALGVPTEQLCEAEKRYQAANLPQS